MKATHRGGPVYNVEVKFDDKQESLLVVICPDFSFFPTVSVATF